jgi:hypothetical protein
MEMKTPTASGAREGTAATWKLGVGDDARQHAGTALGTTRVATQATRMLADQTWAAADVEHGDEEARRPYGASAPEMVRARRRAVEWSPAWAQAEIEWQRSSSSNAPCEHGR